MPTWSTACPDWERRIVAGESLIPFEPLFPAEAAAALNVFGTLTIVDMPGQPTMGETARPWVKDFVAAIFGAYDPDSGRRLITEFFLLISKKNGKSTDAAGIMVTALVQNWRQSAEFFILAPTIEVAENSFKPARDMINASPELSKLLHVQTHTRTITHRKSGATLKVVAADSEVVGGKKTAGVFVDELWQFGTKPKAEAMLREVIGGFASRPEGFVIYATTQSDDPPAGVFAQKLLYARHVRDGVVDDPQFLPILYEFPEAMMEAEQHLDPANFFVTNPNLGLSVDDVFLRRELRKATTEGESSLKGFLAKHLNVEIGQGLRSDRWAGADFWAIAGMVPGLTLDQLLERSEVAVVGIDGGGLNDLLGVAVLGRERETRRWLIWTHAWAHPIVLDRQKAIAPRLLDFKADGDLTLVERVGQDVEEVADIVVRIRTAGLLPEEQGIGVDAAGIGDIVDELTSPERKFEDKQITAISQGWKLNAAIKTTERKIAGLELVHGGSRLMAWCVANARVNMVGNAISVTKQRSGSAKIDPLMATFDAISLMALNPAARKAGVSFFFM
jgi:phage terminase large subunit-like protein